MKEDISKIKLKHVEFYLSTIKYIKNKEDIDLIKILCNEKKLSYIEINNR